MNPNSAKPIVFFDGVCNFCNASVNFLLKHDKHNRLLFSPLQGVTAKIKLSELQRTTINSIIYFKDGEALIKSTAVLTILKDMGGIWKLSAVFIIVPTFIRDFIYSLIAKKRYALFGKRDTCRVPNAAERVKFLD